MANLKNDTLAWIYSYPMNRLVGRVCRFYRTECGWRTYVVKGWYLDSNGCLKTYGDGYTESFHGESQYSTLKSQKH